MSFSYPALENKSTPEDFSYNLKFLDEHGMKEIVLSLDNIFPMHELSKNPIYYPETCHSLIICWFQNKELYFKALNKCTLRQLQAASTLVEMSSKLNITHRTSTSTSGLHMAKITQGQYKQGWNPIGPAQWARSGILGIQDDLFPRVKVSCYWSNKSRWQLKTIKKEVLWLLTYGIVL